MLSRVHQIQCCLRRQFASLPLKYNVEPLTERSLLRVSGTDVADYLQGLITNDVTHLSHGTGSIFTMFLNTKGRILFDAILYRTVSENVFLMECDRRGIEMFQKHLKMYRVRRKVDVSSVDTEMCVYAMFDPHHTDSGKSVHEISRHLEGLIVPIEELNEILPETSKTCKMFKDVHIYSDPRVANLGVRLIAPRNLDLRKEIAKVFNVESNPSQERSYQWLRYTLGVGEGLDDLPIDNSFPLEANCDYLHGISFHKGCYIGQELTARTHHTGVVRKRLMPLYFKDQLKSIPEDSKIISESTNLGKLRGVTGNVGLALLRIEKALSVSQICVGDGIATTSKPFWWPIEAPKERTSLSKN
ncbi:hypothetical protein PPYR_00548 [Photinus pyralis]|uniref:Uncharacterized protein n=1 Tax=Photinus pyralis TaxID=7054 RepID=A0A1Y1LT94_PHOPY|nr:putative transferase CAF17 homolog, mitochondrial [Photinus pyralis]XP_031328915.1 putative transferase CAF17 homolog, mitochondrial [Photinus pyralis]KAB0803575.1 hypothetical protein PPYR_00545 [Photinus pyralis]KAB0803578.1 hypothetical protein PPYR_00548 [Photinus pyralis]